MKQNRTKSDVFIAPIKLPLQHLTFGVPFVRPFQNEQARIFHKDKFIN